MSDYPCEMEHMAGNGTSRRHGSSRSIERQGSDLLVNLSRSSSQGSQGGGGGCKVPGAGLCQAGVSPNPNRPRMTTFCHVMSHVPNTLPHPLPHPLPGPMSEASLDSDRKQQTIQAAVTNSNNKYKQPECV